MIGGFGLWALTREGVPWSAAILAALVAVVLIAYLVERCTFRWQRSASPLVPLVSSLGFLGMGNPGLQGKSCG